MGLCQSIFDRSFQGIDKSGAPLNDVVGRTRTSESASPFGRQNLLHAKPDASFVSDQFKKTVEFGYVFHRNLRVVPYLPIGIGQSGGQKDLGAAGTKTHGQSHFGCTLSVNVDQT